MTISDKEFIESQRWAVECYSQENIPRHMTIKNKERLRDIMQAEFGLNPDIWCNDCFKSFIINAYLLYDDKREH